MGRWPSEVLANLQKTRKETARSKHKKRIAKQQRTRHDNTRKTNDSQTNTHASIHAHSHLAYISKWFFEPSLIGTPSRSGRKMCSRHDLENLWIVCRNEQQLLSVPGWWHSFVQTPWSKGWEHALGADLGKLVANDGFDKSATDLNNDDTTFKPYDDFTSWIRWHRDNAQRPQAKNSEPIHYKTYGDLLLRILMKQMATLFRENGYSDILCQYAHTRSMENELLRKAAGFLGFTEGWSGPSNICSADVHQTGNRMECLLFVIADKCIEVKADHVCLLFYVCIFIFSVALEEVRTS